MAAEKTHALILRMIPYRESSLLMHLFSERHGLIHGIAKGVRSAKSPLRSLDRGALIETLVYVKHHRELHTLGAIQIAETFPATRADLARTAMRDMALEMFLATVTATEPHPELFACLEALVRELEAHADRRRCFLCLWTFLLRFASLLGFGLHFDRCVICRAALEGTHGAPLLLRDGGVACARCHAPAAQAAERLTAWALDCLQQLSAAKAGIEPPSAYEALRLTRTLTRYCRYHFGIEAELRSLRFLEETPDLLA